MTDSIESPTGATEVAAAFLKAVYEGDPGFLWASFSVNAREFVLARGVRRGLGDELAQTLLDDTAEEIERVEFLGDLLTGLEKDLSNVDLAKVTISEDVEPLSPLRVRVRYVEEFDVEVGPPLAALPVGSMHLVLESDEWKVDRLVTKPG